MNIQMNNDIDQPAPCTAVTHVSTIIKITTTGTITRINTRKYWSPLAPGKGHTTVGRYLAIIKTSSISNTQ